MFDRAMRKLIDPPLNRLGRSLNDAGWSANSVTLIGLVLGLSAACALVAESYYLALVLILASRFADGLDGAVARAKEPTQFGGYLDIVCDFAFYGAVPVAFILVDAEANAASGAFLLLSFYINGASFLGYAILAEKAGKQTRAQGIKSLYYSNGLLEGTETIAFFVVLCLLPELFAPLAWLFGTLCLVTASLRVYGASKVF